MEWECLGEFDCVVVFIESEVGGFDKVMIEFFEGIECVEVFFGGVVWKFFVGVGDIVGFDM